MSIMFLISSIVVCFLINLILDLKYFSKKPKKPEIPDLTVATNDEIIVQVEIIGSKINDIFKILKNDNNKNDISEVQTYLKALINDISILKKENENITNLEKDLSNKLNSIDEEINIFKQSIKDNIDELINNLYNLPNKNTISYTKTDLNEEDKEDENNNSIESSNEKSDIEEIDHDFNPGELELEETSIQNIVENTKPSDTQESITIDDFTEKNNTTEKNLEEKSEENEEEIDKENEDVEDEGYEENNNENLSDENEEESTSETETIKIDNITQEDEDKSESEEAEISDSQDLEEDKENLSLEESEIESLEESEEKEKEEEKDDDDEIKDEDIHDKPDNNIENTEIEDENSNDKEIDMEDKKEEDLATKIKRLKERLNSEQ